MLRAHRSHIYIFKCEIKSQFDSMNAPKLYSRALAWFVSHFNAYCGKRTTLTSIFLIFVIFANIFAVAFLPYVWINVVLSLLIAFLLLDGFLLALDLKAAEQRVRDLDIFKSNEIVFLINKARENNDLLYAVSDKLLVLERKTSLILSSPSLMSDMSAVEVGGVGFGACNLNNSYYKNKAS